MIACAALFLPGLSRVPFYTRGEPREGLVAREMLASGRWFVPTRPAGEPARKPPLYYWLAAPALVALGSQPELALRLPSAVLGTTGVLATWWAARLVAGPHAGLPCALVLASSFEWARAATSARVDMTLAATLALVLAAWVALLAGRGRHAAWIGSAAAALATLAKGPVGLVLPALAVAGGALAQREDRMIWRLRAIGQLLAAALVAGGWYVAAFAREGSAFLGVVVRENLLRFIDPEEARTGHAHGAAYLLALGLVGLLPWTPLLPLAVRALRRQPRPPALVLAASWLVTGCLFFALAAAKRSVYLLPVFPAAALLITAGALVPPGQDRADRALTGGARIYPVLLAGIGSVGLLVAFGALPAGLLARALRADDAAAIVPVMVAAQQQRTLLLVLASATLLFAFPVGAALHRQDLRRSILLIGVLSIGWTGFFERALHPVLAEATSLKEFLTAAGTRIPGDVSLFAAFPPDPGLRFYAPRRLERWPGGEPDVARYVLLWEDEWSRAADHRGMSILATSATTQGKRGHLLLVRVEARVSGAG